MDNLIALSAHRMKKDAVCFLEILTTVLYTCIYNIQCVLLHVQRYMWTFCISATIQRIVLILNTEEVIELYYVRICCASIILVFLTLFLLLISTMHSLPNCIWQYIFNYFNIISISTDCANFRCSNGLCVSNSSRCNGANDCGDESDENNCGKIGVGKIFLSSLTSTIHIQNNKLRKRPLRFNGLLLLNITKLPNQKLLLFHFIVRVYLKTDILQLE